RAECEDQGLVDLEAIDRRVRPQLEIAADEIVARRLGRDGVLPICRRGGNHVRAELGQVIACLGHRAVIEVDERVEAVLVDELVVLEVRVSRHELLFSGALEAITEVHQQLVEEKVGLGIHVCELLSHRVKTVELGFDVDALVWLEARYMDHSHRLGGRPTDAAEGGALAIALHWLTRHRRLEQQSVLGDESYWPRNPKQATRVRCHPPQSVDDAVRPKTPPAGLNLAVDGRPGSIRFVEVITEDRADLRRVADSLYVQPVDLQPAAEGAAAEAGQHSPDGFGVGGKRKARHREIEREEPVRMLGLIEDPRVTDAADRVAGKAVALPDQPLPQLFPRILVESPAGDEAQAALLLVLINDDLVDDPVGLGWLEAGCASSYLDQVPARAVEDLARELGHSVGAGGLLHG